LQRHHRIFVKAPAEVPGRRRIREAFGADAVEEHPVASPGFDVVQADPAAQRVVGEVEDVVGLLVRPVKLEEREGVVDLRP
jgi:hypothetical protein